MAQSFISRGGSNASLNSPTSSHTLYKSQPPQHILTPTTRPHSLGSQPMVERRDPGPSQGSYDDWSPSVHKTVPECSSATLENARYTPDGYPRSDHDNEDRHFVFDGNDYQVLGVFDGHDGGRAAGFASNYMRELFDMDSWKTVIGNRDQDSMIPQVLAEFFKATDREFFRSIEKDIEWKEIYTSLIPEVRQTESVYPVMFVYAKAHSLYPKVQLN